MKTLWVVCLLASQETPWSADVAATRQAALEAKKPCVLLINSDAGAH